MDEIPNDFAFLSDDIIHDVLQFAHIERLRTISPGIKPFWGRWGEIAEKFSYFKLEGNKIEEYRLDGRSQSFTAAANNRKDVALNSIRLSRRSDFNKINHLAANAYEWLEVHCVLIPNKFLENLGSRFTSIIWRDTNGSEHIGPANRPWVPVDREIVFLKRQLKSPHLRVLECNSPVLAETDFTDLLVHFVRKKNFQTLKSTSSECLSPEVFKAAYEAWLQRKDGEHLLSSLSAPISTEDLLKLTAIYARDKHPTANHYYTLITWKERCDWTYELTMEVSRDSVKY